MNEIERKKVDTRDLKLGMYVVELDRPWIGTPFLFQGFPITNVNEIEQLRSCCRYVYIDVEQSRQWTPGEPKRIHRDYELSWFQFQPKEEPPVSYHRFSTQRVNVEAESKSAQPQDVHALVEDLDAAKQLHQRTHNYVGTVLADVRLGRSIDVQGARELVNEMVDTIVANENALMWLAQLKRRDEYTSLHSINVCVISVVFGRHLGFSDEQLREIGHGALLHDIGKMRIPLELLNKTTELTPDELAVLKQHPQYGYEILLGSGGISAAALEIVRSHHERVDGNGYPRGLKGDEISEFAMLVSIVDVYDAITTDRVYHLGISPHEALNMMYEWAPKSFPTEPLEQFIKCLGIYPIGSVVELNTGEVGVVMTVNRSHHLYPIITLVLDPDKRPYPVQKLINLELYAEEEYPVNIKRILESNAYGIDVQHIILGTSPNAAMDNQRQS